MGEGGEGTGRNNVWSIGEVMEDARKEFILDIGDGVLSVVA